MKKLIQIPFVFIGTLFLFVAGFFLWLGGVVSFSEAFLDCEDLKKWIS